MRIPFLVASMVCGAAVVASLAQGCQTKTCTLVGCEPGPTVTGHLHAPMSVVARAAVTFCVNDRCSKSPIAHHPPADDAGSGEAGDARDAGVEAPDAASTEPIPTSLAVSGQAVVDVALYDEGDGWTALRASFRGIFTNGTDGGAVEAFNPQDGDRYTLGVIADDGTTLLDFTRALHYSDDYPNGKECAAAPCKVGAIHAWPTSTNALTCSGNEVFAQARFTLHPRAASRARICRNDVCSDLVSTDVPPSSATLAELPGRLPAGSIEIDADKAVLIVEGEPAAFADGDHYVVEVADPAGVVTTAADVRATYVASTPNEPGCDPYPSLTFAYDVK